MSPQIPRDAEGYLINPEDWDQGIAVELAREEAITLDDRYWQALGFMRNYYSEHNITPDVRHLISFLSAHNGCDKKTAKQQVFAMFPYGYVKQACKIAGMKRPRAWSTG